MAKKGSRRLTVGQYKKALLLSAGVQTEAAKLLKVTQPAVARAVKKSTILQEVIARCTEETLDIAESELFRAIRAGKSWAVKFYLKHKGKVRGYVQSQEMTLPVLDKPISFNYQTTGTLVRAAVFVNGEQTQSRGTEEG